jgi:hypothetical protein
MNILISFDLKSITSKQIEGFDGETYSLWIMLWTGYKQEENYKTRQVLLIHQLVLIY